MKNTALITSLSVLTVLLVSACQSSTAVDVRPGTGSQYKSTGPAPAGYHRVQRGENLYRIGLRYNQSVATLTRWNGLRDASQIEVGQLIRVSRSATGNVASNTSGNKTSNSKPTGAWSAPSTGSNVGNVRLSRPVSGNVLANFNGGSNKGIDFGGSAGDSVKAAGAGKVVYVGNGLRGYGNVVMVQHNQSLLTVYAHNDQIKVREGEQVKTGQQLATMGSSGTDRVKLHFEVRQNGKAVNPNMFW